MFFHPKNLKIENNNPWFNILLHTQSILCATVDSQCLEYLGYITLGLILSYLLMYLGVPADQRNRFDLFTIKSQGKVFIKCQMHAYFENLLHSLYTFFPGKQRCWRWRLLFEYKLLNIKCQLFSTAAAGVQFSVSSAPLPSLPAQPSAA